MIRLETERLLLRNYTVSDIDAVYDYFSNEKVARYEDFFPMSQEEVTEKVIEWTTMDNRLLAVLKDTNEVIGSVGYWIDREGNHSIHFDFNPRFGKRGYATEATLEVIRYLFEEKGITELYGDCDIRNENSYRLMERLGFKRVKQINDTSYKNDKNGNPIKISIYIYKMDSRPLLYRACKEGTFGKVHEYKDGAVYEAGFIYLEGKVNPSLLKDIKKRWKYRMFICLSEEWKEALMEAYKDIHLWTRYQMKIDMKSINVDLLKSYIEQIPSEYQQSVFDDRAYQLKPFGHGYNYENYEDFKNNGVGAVIWNEDQIVSSASSFLTYQNEVELNISTLTEYRRKNFGLACAARMLLLSKEKNLLVHWDAQNVASKKLSEKLGYTLEHEYQAYCFVLPEELSK